MVWLPTLTVPAVLYADLSLSYPSDPTLVVSLVALKLSQPRDPCTRAQLAGNVHITCWGGVSEYFSLIHLMHPLVLGVP